MGVFWWSACKGSEADGEVVRCADAGWKETFVVCDEEGNLVEKRIQGCKRVFPGYREIDS